MSVQGVIEKVLSDPVASEGGRHDDINHRMAQLYANGVDRETAISAIVSLYPIGSGKRKITRKELENSYDGAGKLGYKPWDVTPAAGTTNYRRYDQQSAPVKSGGGSPYATFWLESCHFRAKRVFFCLESALL